MPITPPIESAPPPPRRPEPVGSPRLSPGAQKPLGAFSLAALAVVLGIVAGLGAFAFRALIALFHNLLFLGRSRSSTTATSTRRRGPWGYGVVLVPAVGAVVVVFLVKNFAPEAKGHGVPGGDGRHLLQEGRHPSGRRGGQVAGVGDLHRKRGLRGARRAHHPNRRGLRLLGGAR